MDESDLLVRLAALDEGALGAVYDRHAAAVYGYALLITRKPKDARRVLYRTFAALAKTPERASTSGNLRRPLLAIARPIAWGERTKRRWFRKKASFALLPTSPQPLREQLDREPEDVAEETALRAIESLGVRELQSDDRGSKFGAGVTIGATWRPPPRSLRSIALMRAADAARPARKYRRWFAVWALFTGGLALAAATERMTPPMAEATFTPPAESVSRKHTELLRKRLPLLDLLRGLRAEAKKP